LYNPDAAKGVSAFYSQSTYPLWVEKAKTSSATKKTSIKDVHPDWTVTSIPGQKMDIPIMKVNESNWPTGLIPSDTSNTDEKSDRDAFAENIINPLKVGYWYITGSTSSRPGITVQLRIDTHLHEVYALPVKTRDSTTYPDRLKIKSTKVIKWLDLYVFEKSTDISNGEYMFPPYDAATRADYNTTEQLIKSAGYSVHTPSPDGVGNGAGNL
jgi:hypothetical protein